MQETQETPIPGSGRAPGGGNGNPLQHSCLKNSMDRGAWRATVHGGHKDSDMTEHTHTSNSISHKFEVCCLFFFLLFLPHYTACEIFVLQLGIEPMCPQNWEYRGLNTGLPKKSLNSFWSSLLLENLSIRHFLHNLNHYLSNYSTFLWDNLDK